MSDRSEDDWLDDFVAALRGESSARVWMLRGPIGHREAVEAAVESARASGDEATVLTLDLEGWDDEPVDGLDVYVDQMLDKRGLLDAHREVGREMARLVESLPSHDALKPTLLSLAMDFDPPFARLGEIIASMPNDDIGALLGRYLETARQHGAVMIHAASIHDLPLGAARDHLVRSVNQTPDDRHPLVLAISGGRDDDPARLLPDTDVAVLDLPDPDPADLAAAAETLATHLDAMPRYRDNVRDFLRYSAFCGDVIPAELVLAAVGLVEERQEDVLDLVDDLLVESETPLLDETDVQHRAFPRVSMYRFRDARVRHVLLEQLSERERAEIAESLLATLEPRLPKLARAEARLLDAIVAHAADPGVRARYRTVLGVWVAIDECADIGETLHRWLTTNRATSSDDPSSRDQADVLWTLANRTRGRWPAARRVLVLEQFRRLEAHRTGQDDHSENDDAPFEDELRAPYAFLLAEALADAGRFAEAEPIAREACRRIRDDIGEDSDAHASALTLFGTVLHHTRALDASTEILERAVAIRQALHGDAPDLGHAATLHTLGSTFLARGDLEPAKERFEQSLAIQREIYGTDREPNIAINQWRLAQVHAGLGDSNQATELLDASIRAATETLGPDHPATRAMNEDRAAWSGRRDGS